MSVFFLGFMGEWIGARNKQFAWTAKLIKIIVLLDFFRISCVFVYASKSLLRKRSLSDPTERGIHNNPKYRSRGGGWRSLQYGLMFGFPSTYERRTGLWNATTQLISMWIPTPCHKNTQIRVCPWPSPKRHWKCGHQSIQWRQRNSAFTFGFKLPCNNLDMRFQGPRFYLCTQVPFVAVKKWNRSILTESNIFL